MSDPLDEIRQLMLAKGLTEADLRSLLNAPTQLTTQVGQDMVQGDKVGRDKYDAGTINVYNQHITAMFEQAKELDEEGLRREIGRYLTTVINENSHIRLTGIQRQGHNVMDLPLDEVYVPLAARDSQRGSQSIPLTRLLQQGNHLVVTGGPGCGKSTVLMHLAWVLARAMGQNNLASAQQKLKFKGEILPLPILIPLNRFADHLRRHRTAPPEQRTLAALSLTTSLSDNRQTAAPPYTPFLTNC